METMSSQMTAKNYEDVNWSSKTQQLAKISLQNEETNINAEMK